MEEVTQQPARTSDEIKKEYAQLCAQAGENQYRLEVMKQVLNNINLRISQVNVEAEELAKTEVVPAPALVPEVLSGAS